jgi:hypothetical protein
MWSTGEMRDVKYSSNLEGSNVCVRGCAGRGGMRTADHSSVRPPSVTSPARRRSTSLPYAVRLPTLNEISPAENVPSSA